MSQDLSSPRREGATQRADLLDVVFGAAGDRLVDEEGGLAGIVGEVDVARRLLGQTGAEHLVVRVPNAHDMERIGDAGGMREVWVEPGPVGLGQIGGDDGDAGEPRLVLAAEPSRRSEAPSPFTMSMRMRASRSTRPVA